MMRDVLRRGRFVVSIGGPYSTWEWSVGRMYGKGWLCLGLYQVLVRWRRLND